MSYKTEKVTDLPLLTYYRLYFGFCNISQNTSTLWFFILPPKIYRVEGRGHATQHSLALKKKSVHTCPCQSRPSDTQRMQRSAATHPPHIPTVSLHLVPDVMMEQCKQHLQTHGTFKLMEETNHSPANRFRRKEKEEGKSIEMERRSVVARGRGEEGMGSDCSMEASFPFGVMNTLWSKTEAVVAQHFEWSKYHWIAHFLVVKMITFMLCGFYQLNI